MTKRIFNLRNVATAITCLVATMFISVSCEKPDNGSNSNEGAGKEFTITVWGSDSWRPFDGKTDVTFDVSPADIIGMTDNGSEVTFTGLAEGDAVITATAGSDIRKATVHVRPMTGGGSFAIKAASIHYDHNGSNRSALSFDEYGKQCRLDTWNSDGEQNVFIFDGIAKKYYLYDVDEGWIDMTTVAPWNDAWSSQIIAAYTYDDKEKYLLMLPYVERKPNQTIVGKSCRVVGGTSEGYTILLAGWGNLIFKIEGEDYDEMTATSFIEAVPSNAFTQTVDIF
ncbi:MAG: hypothetical protein LBV02_00130 [Bacteroidales bacterium]|jgi:hypothetical protein|nr:hypothetical protein [Bacteroidales bacterium]